MKIRFQADADFNQNIVTIDFQNAAAAKLEGRSDQDVLRLAAKMGRILVTHDKKTMPEQFALFISSQKSSGVLIVPQHLPLHTAIESIINIWAATGAQEWINRIAYLPTLQNV